VRARLRVASADYIGRSLSVDAAGALRFVGEAEPRPAAPMAPRDAALRPARVGEPLVLCTVEERVGGPVTLASGACPYRRPGAWAAANPAVALPPTLGALPPGAARLDADAAFAPIEPGFPGADDGVLVLRSVGALGAGAQLCAAGATALRTVELAGGAGPANASCFRWDERTRLRSLPNEPGAPFAGPAAAGGDGKCPLVQPNFVNEAGCRLAPACAPSPARAVAHVERRLDEAALRAFWELGGTPVYRARGQRFESVYAALTPCTGASRWEPLGGACGAIGRPVATAFADPATNASLVEALLATPDRGINAAVRDLDLGDIDAAAACPGGDAAAARGAVVDADGDCWRHVHPHTLNVYHFGPWAEGAYPGGRDVILQFARAGGVELTFPSWDGMERWEANAGGASILLVGRWGDAAAFGALPPALQLDEVARWWAPGTAAAADRAGAHVACGSPSEGANDPALGARFMYIDRSYSKSPPGVHQGHLPQSSCSTYTKSWSPASHQRLLLPRRRHSPRLVARLGTFTRSPRCSSARAGSRRGASTLATTAARATRVRRCRPGCTTSLAARRPASRRRRAGRRARTASAC